MAIVGIVAPVLPRLLIGTDNAPEALADHLERLGDVPEPRTEAERGAVVAMLEASGLRGRGGAGFPVGTKWRTVAIQGQAARGAAVLVNAAEGEPASAKDRLLLELRPQLVLDGAVLGARVVGASEIVLYVGREMKRARQALEEALHERRSAHLKEPKMRVIQAPDRYVAGEESAAVHRVNGGSAKPTFVPPRPFERGIRGLPTLVQNVESLAHAALIARFGEGWFRSAGTSTSPGSCLLTLRSANVVRVREAEFGSTIGQLLAGLSLTEAPQAVLLGGYFGAWLTWRLAADLPLDYGALRTAGAALGCGVVMALPRDRCGLAEAARILSYLADETAGQCGPCVHGLHAMADLMWRLAFERASRSNVDQLRRWSEQVRGRGACRHPDGAVGMLRSCLTTFADEVDLHLRQGPCAAALRAAPVAPIPEEESGWK
jgi:NADH:ubiquinone oxidoreductase subunit F (NADH-binding)